MFRGTIKKQEQILKILKQMKKNQEQMCNKIEKLEGLPEIKEATSEEVTESVAKQFLKDESVEGAEAIKTAVGIIIGGYSATSYVLDQTLTQEERKQLAENTKSHFILIEHTENNQLCTEYYQTKESTQLFHKEVEKKPWWKLWN